jgi:GTP-binding protein HflX
MRAVKQVLDEVGAQQVPIIDVFNKCDQLTPDEQRRLQEADPFAVCISAVTRQGLDNLLDVVTSRLALDVQRLTLTLDPESAVDRERLNRIYRHARVLEHETRDGRTTIIADVPRRLVGRLDPPRM